MRRSGFSVIPVQEDILQTFLSLMVLVVLLGDALKETDTCSIKPPEGRVARLSTAHVLLSSTDI